MKRRFFPLFVILLAIAVYEGRQVFIDPFLGDRSDPRGDVVVDGMVNSPVSGTVEIPAAAPVEGRISRGTPFFVEMQRAGIAPVDIDRIVKTSREMYNFRRVQPGQKSAVYSNPEGRLDSLHFVIDSERVLKVNRQGEGFVARRDTLPYEIEYYVTSGTINSSIHATLQQQGANPELASYLAVIFQWDIDFYTDIRRGDTFTILYENKVLSNGKTSLGDVLGARVFTRGSEHYAFLYVDNNGRRSYYDERGNSLQKSLLRAPLKYRRISSNFTHRRLHPVTHTYKPHLGVDYVAPVGTPVRSTGDGTVAAATRNRANGNYVKVKHNSRYTTYYLHLRGFARGIRSGVRVRQGQVIGYLGSTGLVTAPHLDYRIKVGGKFVNPRRVKLPSKEPVPATEMALFATVRDACLVRFFETHLETSTVLVHKPCPPLQQRLTIVF
ncbi:MAG: peptidoglycan DD-metalloendopeptidase family protein [Candidatus Krumholzibacteria bacterium]|nr:peptidoglycan DD-metalloendopeptidase family protein [Candidatus Krumholzibacteria bacterium]